MIKLKKSVALTCAMLMFGATVALAQGFDPPSGVCCQKLTESCDHPELGEFEDSIWKAGADTCTE